MDIVREFLDTFFFTSSLNEMIRYRNGEEGRDLEIEDRIEMETFSSNLYIERNTIVFLSLNIT